MRTATLIILLAIGQACFLFPSEETPLFCDEQTQCVAPEPLFCDLNGVYEASDLVSQTCIDPPPGVCTDDTDCEGSQPICGELQRPNAKGEEFTVNECRACASGANGDTECMQKDTASPICESGACVECRTSADCTTDANEPRCDTESGQCVGCVEDTDCASEVCDTGSGQCANAADIIYVATDGTDGAACGTQASRCQTIGGAQGGLDKVTAARKTLKLSDGIYAEDVNISGVTVDILGPATVNPPNDSSSFNVNTGSVVTLKEMTMSLAAGGAAADGAVCSSATLNVTQSTISQNDATGVQADNCTLNITQSTISQNDATGVQADNSTISISRSTISQNDEGGLDINASSFDIQNNFIVANGAAGGGGSIFGGMRLGATMATDTLAFNTIADNLSATGASTSGIDCQLPTLMNGSSNIVYLGPNSTIDSNCNLTHSNIEGGAPGTGNIDADPIFANVGAGDFHLQSGSPCIDMADPAANLAVDVDGDRRPQGSRHDMGADEVVQ